MVKSTAGLVYVFGGYIEGRCTDELWELEPATSLWRKLTSESKQRPEARANHSAVTWRAHDEEVMLVFGGLTQGLDRLNDMWMYHVSANTWEEIRFSAAVGSLVPCPRSEHSAVVHRDHMIVFGGRGNALKELNDMMILNLQTMKWAVGSELCLHPMPDKSFTMGMTRESPSQGKTGTSKGADTSFSAAADAQRHSPSPMSSTKGHEPRSPSSSSPLHRRRKKASPPKLHAAEIESKLEELKILTPTTSAMLHSVVMHAGEKNLESYLQTMKRRRKLTGLLSLTKPLETVDEGYYMRGRIPCARSGHSAELYQNLMVIFAGDRSQVALNDVYVYDLAKEAK